MLGRHKGQDRVKGGTYINYKTGEFVNVDREGGVLPGGVQARYIDMPLPLMLVFGPLLGLAFILFMPAAGVIVLATYAFKAVTGGIAEMKGAAVRTAAPAAIGVSYLQGTRKADETEENANAKLGDKMDEVEGLVIELENEIRQRRIEGQK